MPRVSITIDPRLTAIAGMCGKCAMLADIGTDHGRLGAYMLQTGMCQSVQLTDISAPSLEKARLLIGKLGLNERTRFCVGDGALALDETPDVAVIAGMGGETIARIVESGGEKLGAARLVTQPNVAAPFLREKLAGNGYAITDERIVRDGGRLYVMIAAQKGEARYSEFELNVGPVLMKTRPDALFDYASFRLRVAGKALAGIRAGGGDDGAMLREKEIWEEVLGWQR
jgi:tRNA (adenine22-N1)-methyltransferase